MLITASGGDKTSTVINIPTLIWQTDSTDQFLFPLIFDLWVADVRWCQRIKQTPSEDEMNWRGLDPYRGQRSSAANEEGSERGARGGRKVLISRWTEEGVLGKDQNRIKAVWRKQKCVFLCLIFWGRQMIRFTSAAQRRSPRKPTACSWWSFRGAEQMTSEVKSVKEPKL